MGEIFGEKRVAAYARVSLETDRLSHSLSAQSEYFSAYVGTRRGWELAGVYADRYISGTETSRRPDFNRLIADCEQGRVDVVLCKSISRFARNTVDLLKTVRRLKELGIEVYFEKERLSSLSSDGELVMTILASFAQEESRSISENVKWGIRKRFKAGSAVARNKRVLGYRCDGERYVVIPEEAALVRRIFADYVNKVPLRKIAENLQKSGAKTPRGFDFSHGEINYIVRNELYIGNIVLQKTFVKDFITHTKVKNRGELPIYRFEGCHEAIIDTETFAAAQQEAERRAARKSAYPFTGRIICGQCGKPFTRRSNNGKYACWHCRNCGNAKLKEDRLKEMLGLDDEGITENISKITVGKDGGLEILFFGGRCEKWQYE